MLKCIGTCKQNNVTLKYTFGGDGMGNEASDIDLGVLLSVVRLYHSGPAAVLSYLNRNSQPSTRNFMERALT